MADVLCDIWRGRPIRSEDEAERSAGHPAPGGREPGRASDHLVLEEQAALGHTTAEAEVDAWGEAEVELGVGAEGPDEAQGALLGAAALALALAGPGDAAGEPAVEGGADPPVAGEAEGVDAEEQLSSSGSDHRPGAVKKAGLLDLGEAGADGRAC